MFVAYVNNESHYNGDIEYGLMCFAVPDHMVRRVSYL